MSERATTVEKVIYTDIVWIKMINETLLQSMKNLAQDSDEISPEFVKSLWEQGCKDGELSLLSDIAARETLPLEIEEAARQRKEIPIRISFLSRKSLDFDELQNSLNQEIRAGVLAGVYEKLEIPRAKLLNETFVQHMSKKPTIALAESILTKPDAAEASLAALVIKTLGQRENGLTDDGNRAFRKLLRKAITVPEHVTTAIAGLGSDSVERHIDDILEHGYKIPEIQTLVVSVLVEKKVSEANSAGSNQINRYLTYLNRNVERLLLLNDTNLSLLVKQALTKLHKKEGEHASELEEIIVRGDLINTGQTEAEKNAALNGSANDLLELFKKMDKSKTLLPEPKLMEYIFANPNSDEVVEQIENNIHILSDEFLIKHLRERSTTKLAEALYMSNLSSMVSKDDWVSLGGLKEGATKIANLLNSSMPHASTRNSRYGYGYAGLSAAYELIDIVEDYDILALLPFSMVADIVNSSYFNSRQKAVAKMLAYVLEEHIKAGGSWDTVSILAENFTGSTRELMNTSLNI